MSGCPNKKFCSRCGKLLQEGEQCTCRSSEKREAKKYNTRDFYRSRGWKNMSRFVRARDYNMDRLQLYFAKNKPENSVEKSLYDFCIDAYGNGREFDGYLLVHHVKEVDESWKDRLNESNLISLNHHIHEYIHLLYLHHKAEVQQLLFKAINADLP